MAGIAAGLLGGILNPSESQSTSTGSSWDKSENWSNSSGGSFEEAGSLSTATQDAWSKAWTNAKEANQNAHDEAELARMYQTYMSNTAYQRAVNDLKLAGLNPILAFYGGGSGASTPAGAQAQSFMNSYSESQSKSRSKSSSYQRGGSSQSSSSYGYSKGGSKNNSNSSSSAGLYNWNKDKINKTVGDFTEAGMNLTGTIFGSIWDWAQNQASKMIKYNK